MSFVRTFTALIAEAGVSQTEAALRAGLTQPTLSRILNSKREISAEHVTVLLRALTNESDRQHALQVFLRDQTPEEYRERLAISFGELAETRRPVEDRLTRALRELHAQAEHDQDLERVLLYLANQLVHDHPLVQETRASYSPASVDGLIQAEQARRATRDKTQTPLSSAQIPLSPTAPKQGGEPR